MLEPAKQVNSSISEKSLERVCSMPRRAKKRGNFGVNIQRPYSTFWPKILSRKGHKRARTPKMTSVVDHKTQGGTGNILPIQENIPPRRLTRLEKAKLEALEAFGNCGFDSMVFKKNDFRAKLKTSTSANKPLKRKRQDNDACEVSHSKKPARELRKSTHNAENAVHSIPLEVPETSDKVGRKSGKKRANTLGVSTTNSRTRVSSRVRPRSSVASSKRMTRVEKARLEAMQSFGEQGLDAVWKSCTQIMSKTLEKRKGEGGCGGGQHVERGADNHAAEATLTTLMEGETCEETQNQKKSVEERAFRTIGVGTSDVLVCESDSSATMTTVPEADPEAASVQSCDNKHGHKLTQVQKARMEALQSFAGQKFDEVIKASTRIMAKYLTPCKNQATNTEPCEEQDSLSKADSSGPSMYPKQRIDLFSNIQDTSFVDREALLLTNKRVVETARYLETPSPQGTPGKL